MTRGNNIAILGFSTLKELGLRYLLKDIFSGRIECFGSSFSLTEIEKSDFFILTPEIFASHLDFFLPRKQKTLIAIDSYSEKNLPDDKEPAKIFTRSDESVMSETLEKFLKLNDELKDDDK